MEVVAQAHDGAEAVRLAQLHAPDVVLMDVRMPVLDGLAATRRLTETGDATRILVLTTFDIDDYAFEAIRAGASGFLLKNTRPDDLLAGIRSVANGDAVLAPSTTRRLLETLSSHPESLPTESIVDPDAAEDPLHLLTSRELDVFDALVVGLSNAEIAARLVVSETTVKTHVTRILAKLELRDRIQTVIFAHRHGLANPQIPGAGVPRN
jgi:DNA-binding NarL/FixJ family response regulator